MIPHVAKTESRSGITLGWKGKSDGFFWRWWEYSKIRLCSWLQNSLNILPLNYISFLWRNFMECELYLNWKRWHQLKKQTPGVTCALWSKEKWTRSWESSTGYRMFPWLQTKAVEPSACPWIWGPGTSRQQCWPLCIHPCPPNFRSLFQGFPEELLLSSWNLYFWLSSRCSSSQMREVSKIGGDPEQLSLSCFL